MDPVVVAVFVFVYAGMMLGELPGLALDRTGIALLGAIALVATERLSLDAAWAAVDVPTLALLLEARPDDRLADARTGRNSRHAGDAGAGRGVAGAGGLSG